ncbi:MAG TPA: efflux RND transporter periplasmic adaptor subunit, partial [Denitromonas sp.]|nr:efflux RND transporter periplasmic adaptor subunit [Denitromonas sp.]
MKRPISLTLAAVAVGVTLSAAYWAGSRHAAITTDLLPAAHAEETAAGGGKQPRKILYYRNPMGLPDTSPEPKKDSMGMDYIPVYEGDEPDGEGAVKVSPARLQTLGVKTAMAEMRAMDAA